MKSARQILLGAMFAATVIAAAPFASAQQINGTPGSPDATVTTDGKQIPPPPMPFGGVIKESVKDSTPYWPPRVVPARDIVDRLHALWPLDPAGPNYRGEVATRYRYRDGKGEIGLISSVTEPFCASCDRVRLTAEGRLRACLFSLEETDLRAVLRSGGSDDDVADAMKACVAGKWAGHGIGTVTFVQPPRSMSQIGG